VEPITKLDITMSQVLLDRFNNLNNEMVQIDYNSGSC